MMTMLTGLSALMVLAFQIAGTGGEEDGAKPVPVTGDNMLEVLSTAEMTGKALRATFPWRGPVLQALYSGEIDNPASMLNAEEDFRRLDISQLMGLLRQMTDSPWDSEGVSLDAVGNKLIIVHQPAVIDKMTSAYRRLRDGTSPRLQIQYLLFDAGDSAVTLRPGTLGKKESASLLAGVKDGSMGTLMHEGTAIARTGDSIGMGSATQTAFVGELGVEIAHDSAAGDPIMISLELGQSLTLRPLLAPGGTDVVLFGIFNYRSLHDGVQAERIVTKHLKSIDQLRVDLRQSVFSLRLSDRQAYLLAPGGAAQPGLRVLFSVRRLDAIPQPLPGLALIPTALISTEALRARTEKDRAPSWLSEEGLTANEVAEAVQSLASGDTDESWIEAYPDFLAVKGKAASAARRIVNKLSASLTRSFVVEIRREVKAIEGTQARWQPFGEVIQIQCMGERLGYVMSGYEQSYTSDYGVEIACKESIGQPEQGALFVGFRGWAAVIPVGESSLVHLDLRDSSLREWRRVQAPTDAVGDIRVPTVDQAHIVRQLRMAKNETRSLGEGPMRSIEGVSHRTRLSVKLIER